MRQHDDDRDVQIEADSVMDRRTMLRAAAKFGVAIGALQLTGCGGTDSPSSNIIPTTPTPPTPPVVTRVLVMGVQPPATCVSKLGLYKSGTGSGTLTVSGGAGVGTFSVSQAGVVDVGSAVLIKGIAYYLTAFNGTTDFTLQTTAGGAAPDISGTAFSTGSPVAVRCTTSGVLDTTFTGVVTATLASGSGTLAGITSATAVGGVAKFAGLLYSGTGAFTITFSATSQTSVTSSSCTAAAILATKGDWVKGCYYEPTLASNGGAIPFQLLVPNAASATASVGVLVFCGGSGTQGTENASSLQWGMGVAISNSKGTFPYFALAPQMPPGGVESVTKKPWRAAMPGLIQLLVDAGYTIDKGRLDYYGYSMGGVNAYDLAYMYPKLWRTVSKADGQWALSHLTEASSGVMASLNPATLTAASDEFIRVVGDKVALYDNEGDQALPANDTTVLDNANLWTRYAALGFAASTFNQLTQTVPLATRRARVIWQESTHSTYSHGGMDDPPTKLSNTNYWNWLAAQPPQPGT